MSKSVGVIGVFVSERNLIDALPQQILHRVIDAIGIPMIANRLSQASRKAESLIDLTQSKNAGVGGRETPRERD
jgi:hypothetical protein